MKGTTISQVRLAGIATAVPPLRVLEWAESGIPASHFEHSRRYG